MNKNVLIVIKYEEVLLNKLEKISKIFENILIINNTSNEVKVSDNYYVIKSYQRNYLNVTNDFIKDNKKTFEKIVFIEDMHDISEEIINNSINNDHHITVVKKKRNNFISSTLNLLFNASLNEDLINLWVINAESLESLNNGLKFDNKANNITSLVNKEDLFEINLDSRVGSSDIKEFFSYTFRGILPYFISLLFFLILFNIKRFDNDLIGITICNLIAEGVGVVTHFAINYSSIYKINKISKNLLYILRKLIRVIMGCVLIYVLYNLIGVNLVMSKLIIDLVLIIIITLLYKKLFN